MMTKYEFRELRDNLILCAIGAGGITLFVVCSSILFWKIPQVMNRDPSTWREGYTNPLLEPLHALAQRNTGGHRIDEKCHRCGYNPSRWMEDGRISLTLEPAHQNPSVEDVRHLNAELQEAPACPPTSSSCNP